MCSHAGQPCAGDDNTYYYFTMVASKPDGRSDSATTVLRVRSGVIPTGSVQCAPQTSKVHCQHGEVLHVSWKPNPKCKRPSSAHAPLLLGKASASALQCAAANQCARSA